VVGTVEVRARRVDLVVEDGEGTWALVALVVDLASDVVEEYAVEVELVPVVVQGLEDLGKLVQRLMLGR
jgi:hypothetical protein